MMEDLAEEQNLLLQVISLKMYDATTMAGVLHANSKSGRAELLPTSLFHLEEYVDPSDPDSDLKPLPINPVTGKPYDGVLLFFDELNTVPMTMQSIAYGIMEERRVGIHNLHPDTYIAGAGNHVSNNTGAYPMGPAMQTRLYHISLRSDIPSFLDFAIPNGLDHRIADYLMYSQNTGNANVLNDVSLSSGQLTYPCERSWERTLSPIISKITAITPSHRALIAGAIGEATALDFINFCEVYSQMPTIAEIVQNPNSVPIHNDNPAITIATMSMCARHTDYNDWNSILVFIHRLTPDFQAWFTKQASMVHGMNLRRHVPDFNRLLASVGNVMY